MQTDSTMKRSLLKYFVLTYLIFLVLFGMTGASFALELPEVIPNVLQVVCAWSPTFAFLLLYRRLMPGIALGEFLKSQFRARVGRELLLAIGLQAAVLIGMVVCIIAVNKEPLRACGL